MSESTLRRRSFLAAGAGIAAARFASGQQGARQSVIIPTHEHFGDLEERLDFPGSWELHVMKMAGHDAAILSPAEIRRRIQSPIGARPLREIAAGKKNVIVTFDDLTRPTPTYEVAPLVVEELKAAGIADENILFMTSYGTHRNLDQDEVVRKLGKEICRRYTWINHNTFENLKDVGETSYKNRIKVNQTFLAADVRVTISGVKVHSSAGYGGGAKAVLPGVSWIDTVQYNHGVIGRNNKTTGQVKTFRNDIRLDMIEAARLAKVDFSVQIVYNGRRKVCGIFAGDVVEAHHAAVRVANKHYRTPTFQGADVVVANGYPQNTQATHALGWFKSAREGGSAVLVIQHPQGLSAWHYLNQRTAFGKGRTYWEMMAARSAGAPAHAQLIVYSQYLQKQQIDKFPAGTQFAWNWDEVVNLLRARHKTDARVAVYPYACIQHAEIDLDG